MPPFPDVPREPARCPPARLAVSPRLRGQRVSPRGHALLHAPATGQGDTRPRQGTAEVLPHMPQQALLTLQSELAPGQLERLAGLAFHGGGLRIAPAPGCALSSLDFTFAVAAAMRLLHDASQSD